jgi:hypothetical protein
VDDETGYTLFHAFDHIMVDVASVNADVKVSGSFYVQQLSAFDHLVEWIVVDHSKFVLSFVSGHYAS